MPTLFVDPTRFVDATSTATSAASTITPGTCTTDSNGSIFIWRAATATAQAHWERLPAGGQAQCTSYGQAQSITSGNAAQGGRTVTTSDGTVATGGMTYDDVVNRSKQATAVYTSTKLVRDTFLAAQLPACPASSMTTGSADCYGVGAQYADASLPPGSFLDYGVVFNINELATNGQNGAFVRRFIPDPSQRAWMESAIVVQSMSDFNSWLAGQGMFSLLRSGSVGGILAASSNWVLSLGANFQSNPIPPTREEMANFGGLKAYLTRGGFFISKAVAGGQVQCGDSEGSPAVCVSTSCACPDSSLPTTLATWGYTGPLPESPARPRCIGAFVTKKGLVRGGGDFGTWGRYIAVDDQYFYLKLQHHDPSWWQQVSDWLGEQLKDLAGVLCGNQAQVNQALQAQNAQLCFDAHKKPCKSGSPGCACSPAPSYAAAGTQLFSGFMAQWCSVVAGTNDYNTPPTYEPPTAPASIPVVQPLSKWQLGLIVVAGLGIGALAFSKR